MLLKQIQHDCQQYIYIYPFALLAYTMMALLLKCGQMHYRCSIALWSNSFICRFHDRKRLPCSGLHRPHHIYCMLSNTSASVFWIKSVSNTTIVAGLMPILYNRINNYPHPSNVFTQKVYHLFKCLGICMTFVSICQSEYVYLVADFH